MVNVARTHVAPLGALAIVCLGSLLVAGSSRHDLVAAERDSPRFALLIGVSQYPKLAASEQLRGSRNDVAAVRTLLVERFGFDPAHITTLTDEQATGAGIRAALHGLAQAVQQLEPGSPPAHVYVHFSGHGSQVPDQPPGHVDRDEEDGLDETLVPSDATKQGGDEDIRDDELNTFVEQICADQKARLLLVMDCCHSGTGARGATRVRQLVRKHLQPAAAADLPVARKQLPAGAVFLSACRAQEVEPEFQDDEATFGLLTRFLVGVLHEQTAVSQMSYATLRQAIVTGYERDRRVLQAPLPQMEGSPAALNATILGAGPDIDRPPFWEVAALPPERGRVRLRAGKFHHLTVGSLLELYDRPEQVTLTSRQPSEGSGSLAWLRISQVEGATSQAEVVRWTDDRRTDYVADRLPSDFRKGFAVERFHAPAELTMRLKAVRVQPDGSDGTPLKPQDSSLPAAIRQALADTQRQGEYDWLTWVAAEDAACDLLLRIDGHFAGLFPGTGVVQVTQPTTVNRGSAPASLRGGWGPIDLRRPDAAQQVGQFLRRITRARNLICLAQSGADANAGDYQIQLELLRVRLNESDDIVDSRSWQPGPDGSLTMHEDELYALRVRNLQTDAKPAYVTVLLVGPDMGVDVVMPYQEGVGLVDEIRLDPQESRVSDPFQCTQPFGERRAIVLATREPHDFTFVAQQDLPRIRGGKSGTTDGIAELLLEETHFQTRGDRRIRRKRNDDSWHAQVLSWRGLP